MKVTILILILILSLNSCKTIEPDFIFIDPVILPAEPKYPNAMQWEAKDGGYWLPKGDFTRLRKWREAVETWFLKYSTVYPRADPGMD